MKKYAIIVAGGSGSRMKSDVPKQFLYIGGSPILMRTIESFYQYSKDIEVIVVLPKSQISYWEDLCKKHDFFPPHVPEYRVVEGGATRFHSVQNGLRLVTETESLVAVHDGVRPFADYDVISAAFDVAEKCGAAVPVVDCVDSVREIGHDGKESIAKDRSQIKLVQTPQVFSGELLKAAYSRGYNDSFTDDASVVEAYGHCVVLTQGNRMNIKITTPLDIKIANCFLQNR